MSELSSMMFLDNDVSMSLARGAGGIDCERGAVDGDAKSRWQNGVGRYNPLIPAHEYDIPTSILSSQCLTAP